MRLERPDGGYTITDYRLHKSMFVEPKNRSVRMFEGMNLPPLDFYEMFRSIAANPLKTLRSREINGTKAVGFVVRPRLMEGVIRQPDESKPEITVWVDPRTKLPLRIESISKEQGGVALTQAYTKIVFDEPLDAALFDMTPPAGYSVESLGIAKLQPELEPGEAADLVITPGVGIGPVKFGMKTADVIQLLGPPDKTLDLVKGMDVLEYYSRGYSITARDERGVIMISCYTGKFFAIKVRAFAGRTDKGLRLGANRAAIEKAYGPPDSVREVRMKDAMGKRAINPGRKTGQVDLTYSALGLSFSLHADSLDSIMVRAPRPPKSAESGNPTKQQ